MLEKNSHVMEQLMNTEERILNSSDLSEREVFLLRRTFEIAQEAKESGNHPFGCLLADKEGNILMEMGNREVTDHGDCTAHAETLLMRYASQKYTRDQLKDLIFYSCAEPCAMCSGALYWGNIRKVVYAGSEASLKELTGNDPRNPTLNMPCRIVFAAGQKEIEVIGPVADLEKEFLKIQENYWNPSKTKNR